MVAQTFISALLGRQGKRTLNLRPAQVYMTQSPNKIKEGRQEATHSTVQSQRNLNAWECSWQGGIYSKWTAGLKIAIQSASLKVKTSLKQSKIGGLNIKQKDYCKVVVIKHKQKSIYKQTKRKAGIVNSPMRTGGRDEQRTGHGVVSSAKGDSERMWLWVAAVILCQSFPGSVSPVDSEVKNDIIQIFVTRFLNSRKLNKDSLLWNSAISAEGLQALGLSNTEETLDSTYSVYSCFVFEWEVSGAL